MGLLNSVIATAAKALLKQDSGAQNQVSGLLSELFSEVGGLTGLIQKFQSNGFGDIIGSWMSDGEKQSISSDQLSQVVGKDLLQNLAGKSGLDQDMFGSLLASGLPKLVSSLTQNGQRAPEDVKDITLDKAKGLLDKFLS